MARPTKLNEEKIQLLVQYRKQQRTHREIAELLGVSIATTRNYCYRMGLLTGRKPSKKRVEIEERRALRRKIESETFELDNSSEYIKKRIKHLHLQECTVQQITQRLNISSTTVLEVLHSHGYLPHQETAFLTANEVQEKLDKYLAKRGLLPKGTMKYSYGRGPWRDYGPAKT